MKMDQVQQWEQQQLEHLHLMDGRSMEIQAWHKMVLWDYCSKYHGQTGQVKQQKQRIHILED